MTIRRVPTAFIYLALMPVAMFASIFAQYLVITGANAPPRSSLGAWMVIPLNVIPAAVAGFLVYRGPAERARASGQAAGFRRHLLRVAPLYVGILLFGAWLSLGIREPGFGLFGQLILWPLTAFLGGVFADLHAGRRRQVHAAAA